MNWKRGFLRLWIVLAVVWIAASLLAMKPWREIGHLLAETPTVVIQPAPEVETEDARKARLLSHARQRAMYERARMLKHFAPKKLGEFTVVALAPPVGVFLLGWLVAWVVGGFKRKV